MALSALQVSFQLLATLKATISEAKLPNVSAADRQVTVKNANLATTTLDSSTTPALEGAVSLNLTMATGTPYALDLTAAPQLGGEDAVDLTAKKLIGMIVQTPNGNTSTVEIRPHSTTNAYDLFGSGAGIQVPKDSTMAFLDQVATRDAVDSSNKVIEFSGTTGDTIEVVLVFGT